MTRCGGREREPEVGLGSLILPLFVKKRRRFAAHNQESVGVVITRILCMYQVYALPHCIAYASFMIPRGFKDITAFLWKKGGRNLVGM